MSHSEIVDRIFSHAADACFDTVVGRAFFRAVGACVIEPRIEGANVSVDRYEGAERLMAQRYGIAY